MTGRQRLAVAGAALAIAAAGGGVAYAATSPGTGSCTANPTITDGATTQSIRVTCSWPKPAPVAVTSTVTQTVMASPTATSTTSTPSTTTTEPLPTTTSTPTVTEPPSEFPDATTTGPRVALTAGPGNVCGTVTGRLITGDLTLGCDSTITDSRIMGRVISNGHRLTGSYLEIGPDTCPTTGGDFQLLRDVFTLDHAHLHNAPGQDPVALVPGTSTLTESLIDRPCFYAGDHLDGAQVYAPGSKVVATLDHNNIDVRPANSTDKGNAAIFLADNPGAGTVITMTNNRLAGGNYTLSAYDARARSGVVYDARNNTMVRGSWVYGPCATNSDPYDGTSGFRFTGNTYDDGTPVGAC